MPTLHNPAEYDLTCYRLGLTIKAGGTVEISDEDADALDGGPIFIVEGRKGARKAAEASQEDAETAEEPEAEEKAAPQRKTAKRGGKQVEVTTAPETEKRG